MLETHAIKDEAKRLVESLPENATWNDLMYEIYVRKEIEAGLDDLENGRWKDHDEVKKLFNVAS